MTKLAHVFISYSSDDHEYAEKLAQHLIDNGINIWFDRIKIKASDDWWESIVEGLESASALIVLMSDSAAESKWVNREITLADQFEIPTFPLWVSGNVRHKSWLLFVRTQYTDVRDQSLPDDNFLNELKNKLAEAEQTPGEAKNVSTTPSEPDKQSENTTAVVQNSGTPSESDHTEPQQTQTSASSFESITQKWKFMSRTAKILAIMSGLLTLFIAPLLVNIASDFIIKRMESTPMATASITATTTDAPVAQNVTLDSTTLDTEEPPDTPDTISTSPSSTIVSQNTVAPTNPVMTDSPVTDTSSPVVSTQEFTVPAGNYQLDGRDVTISDAYSIDQLEVTREDYARFMRESDITFETDAAIRLNGIIQVDTGLPMTAIMPEEAQAYCAWVEGRLPSPDEWLIAYGIHPDTGQIELMDSITGNIGSNSPVLRNGGLYPASALNLHDMVGNVSEWAINDRGDTYTMGGNILSSRDNGILDLVTQLNEPDGSDIQYIGFRCVYPA